MNKIRSTKEEAPEQISPRKKKSDDSTARKFIRVVNVFGYFDRTAVVSFMPYLFFLFLLALFYIGNSYYAEKTIRDIDKTAKDIKELRAEFITVRSDLMYRSKLTAVAAEIQSRGIKESTMAPRKILIKSKTRH